MYYVKCFKWNFFYMNCFLLGFLWTWHRFPHTERPANDAVTHRGHVTQRSGLSSSPRSFLPRVQWALCGPTPCLFSAVYLLNVAYYSRKERTRERKKRRKTKSSKNRLIYIFKSFGCRSTSSSGGPERSGLHGGIVLLQQPRVLFFLNVKCTCSVKPVACLPTLNSKWGYV